MQQRRTSVPLLLLLGAVTFILVWELVLPRLRRLHDPDAESRPVAARGELAGYEKSTIEIYRTASPSVVHVDNMLLARNPWTMEANRVHQGSGSGFVWSPDGYVVTNAHVVAGGNRFSVTLSGDDKYEAVPVGVDEDNDIAVLRLSGSLPPTDLLPLAIGTSGDLQVGQAVFAIGNPFGLDQTLTTGVISGLDRVIRADTGRRITGVIQTDAAVNPGNSGGPLLDSAGRLIGMNTAIASPTGAYAGIGFAVPVDTINRIVPRLIRGEKPPRAGLGVSVRSASGGGIAGAFVMEVVPGSAAEAAGIMGGDLITAVNGEPVESNLDLLDALAGKGVGEKVAVTVRREEGEKTLEVTLQRL